MKKVLLVVLATIIILGVFGGCSKQEEEPSPEPTPAVAEATPTPTPEPTPEPTPTPYIPPENISPTTGLENTTTEYAPVFVQIDNDSYARGMMQSGLQLADIVYETPIEDPDTRLSCIYNDIIYMPGAPAEVIVGPVRSSRYYHQLLQAEWDALYVHMGGPDSTNNAESNIWSDENNLVQQRINGAGKGAVNSDMFQKHKSGKSLSILAMTDVVEDAAIYNYVPTPRQPFTYYPPVEYADAPLIEKVELSFVRSPGFVEYRYDADKDKLIRYMNGEPHMTEESEEPIEVQNLIIQYTNVANMPNDGGRKKVDVFGEGRAEFIINGRQLTGTWSRDPEDRTSPTIFYLDSGEEVTLTPGNTWIAVHPDSTPVITTYADGTSSQTN